MRPALLGAVLAHEQAHLAGRHHLLITLTRALSASFPAVPLFTRGPREVARLAEMCADDAAARRSGGRAGPDHRYAPAGAGLRCRHHVRRPAGRPRHGLHPLTGSKWVTR